MQRITDEKPNRYGIVHNEQFYVAGDFYAAYEYLKGKCGTDSHPSTAARIDVGERGGVLCRCGWHGYRGELMRQDDWERTHPANKNLSMEDMKAGRGHVTKFESCPNCGRAIFADGFPTGIAKAVEPLEETV